MADTVKEEIAQASERIWITAEQDARLSQLLLLYGIGRWTALLIVIEIGEIGCFPNSLWRCGRNMEYTLYKKSWEVFYDKSKEKNSLGFS